MRRPREAMPARSQPEERAQRADREKDVAGDVGAAAGCGMPLAARQAAAGATLRTPRAAGSRGRASASSRGDTTKPPMTGPLMLAVLNMSAK